MKNMIGETTSYDIYHFPTSEENLNIKFIDKSTIEFDYRGGRYTIQNIDNLQFKLKPVEIDTLGFKGVEFQNIISKYMTIDITDDNFTVYQGKTLIIPIANIMANDIDVVSGGLNPLSLNGISNITLGTAIINGSNIEYTNTSGNPGDVATITYEAQNLNGDITTGTINILIEEIPAIICNPDTFDLQQGETLLLSKSALSDNDVDSLGQTLTVQTVLNPVNGTVTLNGDNVSFTSTGVSGFPAEFDYTVTNEDGLTQTGKVYINVTPLPLIEAYLFETVSEAEDKVANYTPPTPQTIFDSWGRFDGADFYEDKTTATGNADDWELLSDPERVSMPTNVGPINGFVSPKTYTNYTFEATLNSDSTDDDAIGLVAAFINDNGVYKTLAVIRTQGGTALSEGWGVIYYENGSAKTALFNMSVGGVNKNSASGDEKGWNNRSSRVKIERRDNIITCYATEWDDLGNYQLYSKLEIDLDSDDRFAAFKNGASYGYYTLSQPNSTYLDVTFKGGVVDDKIFAIENNTVWAYTTDWAIDSNATIQSELGYVRDCFNPDTNKTFTIKGDEVILKV